MTNPTLCRNRSYCGTREPLRGDKELTAGLCYKCLPRHTLAVAVLGLGPLGLDDEDDDDTPRLECDSCGAIFEVNDAELERAGRGGLVHCDSCTDPDFEAEYAAVDDLATEPNCCGADGCLNNSDEFDDGLCDFCDEPAVTVDELAGESFHLCETHADEPQDDYEVADDPQRADEQDDTLPVCDRCGRNATYEDTGLCALCADQLLSGETGYDMYGRRT